MKVDTADEMLASIVDAAGCITRRADQLRRTKRDLRTPDAKCRQCNLYCHLGVFCTVVVLTSFVTCDCVYVCVL
jgi:hypothetical protein